MAITYMIIGLYFLYLGLQTNNYLGEKYESLLAIAFFAYGAFRLYRTQKEYA